MELAADIVERIESDFADADDVRRSLEYAALSERATRCIIFAAKGSPTRLHELMELAANDVRDVIVLGENDGGPQCQRCLAVSFLIDSPEKFWINSVAYTLHGRGYYLVSITTRKTEKPPADAPSDFAEGLATFLGPRGEIVVEKSQERWRVIGDADELRACFMDRSFDRESEFRDALSAFLLVCRD